MFVPRFKKKQDHTEPNDGHRYGIVRCPKCATSIDVVGWHLKLADEFSVRCTVCHCRSFHTRTAMAVPGSVAKTNG